ncbi:chloride channel protein [Sulfurivermis fontis]|uniref:chloride channel protein n=1 Tax=Sulfurivermis fontis TaxID=1972068 RepID=UPI000FD755D7|nr:chloride channel protein [Sulfurivermis fontis]
MTNLRLALRARLDRLSERLAAMEALPQLAALGLLSGLLAGAVIIAFRLVIHLGQVAWLPEGQAESFETVEPWLRLAVATAGGLVVGLLLQALPPAQRMVGVVHVMERLSYHQGHLPLRNLLTQFVGAAICLVSGHSVGREGPSIHLGAAAGSQVGRRLGLPNNSIRTLVACGTAAAIAASFNTPIAGVIFAMEVVMMEYTIAGFTPVILAAVSGAVLTRAVFGDATAFSVPALEMHSLWELPWLVVIGLVLGTLSAAFIRLLRASSAALPKVPLWLRTTLAGAIVGLLALAVPQIMGVGYDTMNAMLLGEVGLGLLLAIAVFKLLATTLGLGLGLPGGLIGPTLVIGAAAGGALGVLGGLLNPGQASSPGFYAMVGMGAMMSATLQAPLAALMAMLELTGNPNIILPGMLAVVIANLVAREVFRQESIYLALMRARGLDYRNDPVAQSLRRVGVAAVMERSFAECAPQLERAAAERLLAENPRWLLVRDEERPLTLLPAADLAHALSESEAPVLDLMAIPARRRDLAPIHLQATLQEALETLQSTRAEVLYVQRTTAPFIQRIYGVLTREAVEENYRYR